MKLCLNNFTLVPFNEGYHYHPVKEFLENDFYEKKLKEYNKKHPGRLNKQYSLKWVFNVSKDSVFKELGWEQNKSKSNHFDDSYGFPFFKDKEQSLLFLTVAIVLHNETVK